MDEDDIAKHLQAALQSGELKQAASFGKPLASDHAFTDTPDALRMPFKVLKQAGFVPPEVDAMHARQTLREALAACSNEQERREYQRQLADLELSVAVRIETLRRTGTL
jgi:hypothetical protein